MRHNSKEYLRTSIQSLSSSVEQLRRSLGGAYEELRTKNNLLNYGIQKYKI